MLRHLAIWWVQVLVVMDDIWEPEALKQFEFIGQDDRSKMIVTSRFSASTVTTSPCDEVAVGLLSEDAAKELLFETAQVVAPLPATVATGNQICKLCGYLPLYITMIGQ